MTIQLIQDFEKKFKGNVNCNFEVGDTIRVHTKIVEGEKERVQLFTGIVVAFKGKGLSKSVTVYRNAYGCSMERIFILSSPKIFKIELEKKGKVRKSKLYHLRGESGKKAKIEEQILAKEGVTEEASLQQVFSEPQAAPVVAKAEESKVSEKTQEKPAPKKSKKEKKAE